MIVPLNKKESGFTVIEGAVVVLLIGVAVTIAAPRISNGMRQYRINIATRQIVDSIKRAKMHAVSENRSAAISVDVSGRRAGVVFYNDDGTVNRTEFVPLPTGVGFQRKSGVSANPTGVTSTGVVSFAQVGSYYQQDFNSRGFPKVASGSNMVSIFLGNGTDYRAITISSVGGIQTYRLENDNWVSTR